MVRTFVGIGLTAMLVGGGIASAAIGGFANPDVSSRGRTAGSREHRPTPDGLTIALERGRLSNAEYALERASSLFQLGETRRRFGDVERPDPHDATLFLRDLVLHKDELSGSDRRRAGSILARPTDGNADPEHDGYKPGTTPYVFCQNLAGDASSEVCFTWVESSSDATHVDHVSAAANEMQTVWDTEIGDLGYRQPQRDGEASDNDVNGALDIYFADIGDDGLYGYCASDEPRAARKKTVSAYCVLDNDYDPGQYDAPPPEVSGLDALKVTLAHEFFHTVQFSYDWREALFLMEGTATWIEDEVYDGINANYAYLFDSALHQPEIPLNAFQRGDDDENFEYGAFIFFTYMSETHQSIPDGVGRNIVRFTWRKAGRNKEGIGAVRAALNEHGFPGPSTPYRDFFAKWGAANSVYDFFYSEGLDGDCTDGTGSYADVLRCWRPPFDGQYLIEEERPSTGWRSLPMNRLSNRIVELFNPDAATSHLIQVNLPDEARGGEATLLVFETGKAHRIKLDREGRGSKVVSFSGTAHLILSNTGSHNNETYKFKAGRL